MKHCVNTFNDIKIDGLINCLPSLNVNSVFNKDQEDIDVFRVATRNAIEYHASVMVLIRKFNVN